ncbi:MAG TPA: ABC transporter permease subunit [Acidimicrobiales bacterium]|nr:ABC transporter permease subunit [Acidimicrobiales bacterium]
MTALLAGELRRLLSRRLVRVLLLLAVLAVSLAGVLTFVNTEKTDPAAVAARLAEVQRQFQECFERDAVRRGPPGPVEGPGSVCDIDTSGTSDDSLPLVDLSDILKGTTAPLVIVGWLLGASAIGADWQSRTLTTLLTWEPRRTRVLLGKAAAAMIVAALFFLVAQALLFAALLPSVLAHGTTAGADAEWAGTLAGVVGRGGITVAVAAGIGFALASVGRNTAAALGAGFAYVVVIEQVVGGFLEDWRRWLLLGNIIVFVSGESGGGDEGIPGRSVLGAGLFLTLVALGLLLAAAAVFRQRDVA